MSLPIIPGPGNTMITQSSFPEPYLQSTTSGADLSVKYLTSDVDISKSAESADEVYAINAWNGNVEVALPYTDGNAQYRIKKLDSSANQVIVYGKNNAKIEGSATRSLGTQWDSFTLVSQNSASWLLF